ncbi:MAG: sulfite exporter TauE/SafE family protein [Oscillospiraceae bacterium]|jgi:uncharacterized membrane protein YfcA|nr:sulfite exporter TauE/SafE family protein [Oscillospiraceae bacterium]
MNWLIDAIFSITSGVAGSVGLGGGAILIMYLTAIVGMEQTKAQGINLIFFIPVAFVASIIYFKRNLIKWKIITQTVPSGILGAFLTFLFLKRANYLVIGKIFGLFLIAMGVFIVVKEIKVRRRV